MRICMGCGNREKFQVLRRLKQWATEYAYYNGVDDEPEDYGDYETDDSECVDEDEMECVKCSSTNIFEGTKQEITKIRLLHTKKDGTWSEDELPEDEQNLQIIVEQI